MQIDVQKIWETFEGTVLGSDAGDIQRAEMRMAFVAGMHLGSQLHLQGDQTSDCIFETDEQLTKASREYAQGGTSLDIYYKYKSEGTKNGN